jgi:hypothetical protein
LATEVRLDFVLEYLEELVLFLLIVYVCLVPTHRFLQLEKQIGQMPNLNKPSGCWIKIGPFILVIQQLLGIENLVFGFHSFKIAIQNDSNKQIQKSDSHNKQVRVKKDISRALTAAANGHVVIIDEVLIRWRIDALMREGASLTYRVHHVIPRLAGGNSDKREKRVLHRLEVEVLSHGTIQFDHGEQIHSYN